MTKPKFTPGPWVLGSNRTQVLQREKGPYRLIASTSSPDCIDGSGDHSLDVLAMYANARLIAAAPDMYQVLRSIQELVNGEAFHDEKNRLLRWQMVDQVLRMVEGKEDV